MNIRNLSIPIFGISCLTIYVLIVKIEEASALNVNDSTISEQHPFGTEITYEKLAVGRSHACALRFTGEIDCVGDNGNGVETPTGIFVDVFSGTFQSCGIRDTEEFVCWGKDVDKFGLAEFRNDFQNLPPMTKIELGKWMVCGLDDVGAVHCYSRLEDIDGGTPQVFDIPIKQGPFVDISLKQNIACGVLTDGSGVCWDYQNNSVKELPVEESWKYIKTGHSNYFTGLNTNNEMKIWGGTVSPNPLTGSFADIGYNLFFQCGSDYNGIVSCEQHVLDDGVLLPPNIGLKSWKMGGNCACGLDGFGTVHCWGKSLKKYEPKEGDKLRVPPLKPPYTPLPSTTISSLYGYNALLSYPDKGSVVNLNNSGVSINPDLPIEVTKLIDEMDVQENIVFDVVQYFIDPTKIGETLALATDPKSIEISVTKNIKAIFTPENHFVQQTRYGTVYSIMGELDLNNVKGQFFIRYRGGGITGSGLVGNISLEIIGNLLEISTIWFVTGEDDLECGTENR